MTSFDGGSQVVPKLGDEAGFVRYEEKFMFELQSLLRQKPGMDSKLSVLQLCADLEDLVYRQVQEELKIEGVPVWSRYDALDEFRKRTGAIITRVSQSAHLDWAALYDEHHEHIQDFYDVLLGRKAFHTKSRSGVRTSKAAPKAPKRAALLAEAPVPSAKKKAAPAPKKAKAVVDVAPQPAASAPPAAAATAYAMQVDDEEDFYDGGEGAGGVDDDELLDFDFDGDLPEDVDV
eukprot:gene16089-11512_t